MEFSKDEKLDFPLWPSVLSVLFTFRTSPFGSGFTGLWFFDLCPTGISDGISTTTQQAQGFEVWIVQADLICSELEKHDVAGKKYCLVNRPLREQGFPSNVS